MCPNIRNQCVKEQSATYGKENFGLSVDHSGLNKYTSKEDGNYKKILSKLLDIVTPIISQKQHQLYSVPITTVESYVRRDLLSTKIEDELRKQSQEIGVPRVLLVHGLGGTGKTQLVRQYIGEHKDEYNPILWVDAMDEGSVRMSFERCAGELGLPVDPRGTTTSKLADSPVVQDVLRWLRNTRSTDDKWLIVIDNADDHELGIRSIIPEGNQGSVIITSQDRNLLSRTKFHREVSVDVLDPSEAKILLLKHLKLDVSIAPDDVLAGCEKIAEKLGYLPLAVDLAGAYIGNDVNPIRALGQYLTDYEKQQDFLLESNSFCDFSASDKTVRTVWSTTLTRIEQRHTGLRPGFLLAFLARFHSDGVQEELLRLASLGLSTVTQELYGGTAELPNWLANILKSDGKDWVDFYYRQGCEVLVRYSLLQRTTGTWPGVRMHSLVQWRAKKYEEEQPWEKWHLMTVLAGCYQLYQYRPRLAFRKELVTSLPTLDERCLNRVDIGDMAKAFVWNTVGMMHSSMSQWKEAEMLFVQTIEITTRVLGRDHPNTLVGIANLGSMYGAQGRWKEAEAILIPVMATSLRVLGEDHISTRTIKANLASIYLHQGREDEGEKLFMEEIEATQRAIEKLFMDEIEKTQKVIGKEHSDTPENIPSLEFMFWWQSRWDETEGLFRRVPRVDRRIHHNARRLI